MNVKYLKQMIEDLPDEALVLIEGGHGSILEARFKTGYATDPNGSRFTNFMEEKLNDNYTHEAVFFYKDY